MQGEHPHCELPAQRPNSQTSIFNFLLLKKACQGCLGPGPLCLPSSHSIDCIWRPGSRNLKKKVALYVEMNLFIHSATQLLRTDSVQSDYYVSRTVLGTQWGGVGRWAWSQVVAEGATVAVPEGSVWHTLRGI